MLRTLVSAIVLTLSPMVAYAGCGAEHASQQTMSCADGLVWDSESHSCIKVTG